MAERAWRFARAGAGGPLASLPAPPPLEAVHAAALEGDGAARRAIEEGARALGAGLANVVQLLDPHRIALCGGVLELGEPFLEVVRAELRARTFRESHESLVLTLATERAATGAIGAAVLARRASS